MGQTINPYGKDIISIETEFCGRPLKIETNRLAFRASSVTVTYGETVVLGTANARKDPNPHAEYFPLMIDYEERFYAAGKISGSRFIKREGRPSDKAVLVSRLIDRPIRPLFPKGYMNEVQGTATVLSMDPELAPDTIAMIAVSCALRLTGAPFEGPVAGVRMGVVDGKLTAFPTNTQLADSKLDLVVAGTKDGVMMVEAGANEVDEDTMVEALDLAFDAIQSALELQNELVEKVGAETQVFEVIEDDAELSDAIQAFIKPNLGENLRGTDPEARLERVRELRQQTVEHFCDSEDESKPSEHVVKEVFAHLMKKEVRRSILEEGLRPDLRKPADIRPLSSEVGVLPRAHGSSIFTRGLTQALNVTTLASTSFAQIQDTMDLNDNEKYFMHHYNFPAYSVGDIRPLRGPGRREIGHGALAERALEPVMPKVEDFPYTIRTVSEILSSSGSSSMASVCSGCLSLMDAGVPISKPVSGIAMGLISDGTKQVVLSDIMDEEDFAGDMDFKVAGTPDGITALQMDIKVKGLTTELLKKALQQAKDGRKIILDSMLETIPEPRAEMSPFAPRIETIMVDPDKVGAIIGKGGETINKIIDETGVEIDIKDGGIVMVAAADKDARDKAVGWIKGLVAEPEVGKVYNATVVSIKDFGVFVEFMPGKDGLVHVSEMSTERVENPSDIVKVGDVGPVKVIGIDDQGRVKLSMKQV